MTKIANKRVRGSHATIILIAGSIALTVLPSLGVAGGAQVHWGYTSEIGPAVWAKLSPLYKTCKVGTHQSPIDIPNVPATLKTETNYSYRAGPATIVNNGHTVEVKVSDGNVIHVGTVRYRLVQFHFHTPSENKINGKQYPMEMHMVHASADGRLAVVAVMIEPGGSNPVIDRLAVPSAVGRPQAVATPVDPIKLLPTLKSHYAFTGSLTTPPCTEGVHWFVATQPIKVSAQTIQRFHAVMGKNNRPVNPLNARAVIRTN